MTNPTTTTQATSTTAKLLKTPLGKICLALLDLPIGPKRPAEHPQPQQLKGLTHANNANLRP